MITALIGFFYWLGNQGQLDLWTCSPTVAWWLVLAFVVECFLWLALIANMEMES
jgi:hypothetical protein